MTKHKNFLKHGKLFHALLFGSVCYTHNVSTTLQVSAIILSNLYRIWNQTLYSVNSSRLLMIAAHLKNSDISMVTIGKKLHQKQAQIMDSLTFLCRCTELNLIQTDLTILTSSYSRRLWKKSMTCPGKRKNYRCYSCWLKINNKVNYLTRCNHS